MRVWRFAKQGCLEEYDDLYEEEEEE